MNIITKDILQESVERLRSCGITKIRHRYILLYASDVSVDKEARRYARKEGIRLKKHKSAKESHIYFMQLKDYLQYLRKYR